MAWSWPCGRAGGGRPGEWAGRAVNWTQAEVGGAHCPGVMLAAGRAGGLRLLGAAVAELAWLHLWGSPKVRELLRKSSNRRTIASGAFA